MEIDNEKLVELLALYSVADDIGFYPAKYTVGGKTTVRSERQEGWNECAESVHEKRFKVWSFLEKAPDKIIKLIIDESIYLQVDKDGKVRMFVNCNDLFFWACAESEEIEEDEIDALLDAIKSSPSHGTQLWVCRKRGMRPQAPYYKYFTSKERSLFDACGPERTDA